MADGFLSRWSRRKSGKQEEPAENAVSSAPLNPEQRDLEVKPQESELPPAPSMEDVEKIDRFAPDFSAFMRPDVDPSVQSAALKKMFTDPHFNVMDGLDIYIDDYSKPDPLPPGMLEKMVQSDMLKLFQKSPEVVDHSADASIPSTDSLNAPVSEASSESDLTSKHLQAQVNTSEQDVLPINSDKNKT